MLLAAIFSVCSCASGGSSAPAADSSSKAPTDTAATATEPDSSFLGKKRAEGIDFYAVGQEPGWSLNLDKEKIFSFSTFDGIVMNTPPVAGIVSADGNTTTYEASVEMGELRITITHEACTDIMSGQAFTHRVQVRIRRGIDKDYRTYEGCGRSL